LKFGFFFSFLVIGLQTSSYLLKVSLPRPSNQSLGLGLHELKFWLFLFILCNWISNLNLFVDIWAHSLAHMSWNFDCFFIICHWTSNLKLFAEGPVAETFISEPKAWLIEIFNFFSILCDWTSNLKVFVDILDQGLFYMSWILDFNFHSLKLNYKPQAICWYMSPRLGSHELKFWFFLSFFVTEVETSSYLLISEPKAWLTWVEILIFLFILCDWTSNLKLFVEGLVAETFKSEPKA
jgi:hypothetical protein